jgi:hypothetical protein
MMPAPSASFSCFAAFGSRAAAVAATAVTVLIVGCSSAPQQGTTAPSAAAAPAAVAPAATPAAAAAAAAAALGPKRLVKSRDGSFEGEIYGTPAPSSRFAKLLIGMTPEEVQKLMGSAADRSHSYESGKRWIPFYYGNDARRMQMLYKGEGCLIFTDGNRFGGGGGDLIQIAVDPTGACYQP